MSNMADEGFLDEPAMEVEVEVEVGEGDEV